MAWAGAKRKSDGGKGKDGNSKRPSTVDKKTKKLAADASETLVKKRKEVSEKSEKSDSVTQQPSKKAKKADPKDEGSAVQRKDAAAAESEAAEPPVKKKKLGKKEREAAKKRAQAGGDGEAAAAGPAPSKKRYTLFVGNLPYDITKEEIQEYFGKFTRNQVESVRMLTDRGTGEFKGTCFVDLKDSHGYEVCLRLHHTKLQDRKINVEPTVGGGGTGENRRKKLKSKTQKFTKQRQKRVAKGPVAGAGDKKAPSAKQP